MFFKKLDTISPPITIYFKGDSSHSSIFSGILSLIVFFISTYFGIQYTIGFLLHKDPKVYFYNRYIEDAGNFSINSSQLFSFVQVIDTESNIPKITDFNSLRIIGIETTIDLYKENNDLSKYNHWIYGQCNNKTDTQDISHLIEFENFTESACIRKYYNKEHKKYYHTNDINFVWPNLNHGCSHPKRTFYGIIVEKCRNDSMKILSDETYCNPPEEIIEYIKKSSLNLQLIDNYADVLNYEHPFTKYFYSVSSGLFEESYTTNHLNFNPMTLVSNDAIFFDNIKRSFSYAFHQNEKTTSSMDNSGIYVSFYFWMQNNMHYYDRKYKNFQDALSDIGGLGSLLLNLAYFLNILVSNFVILFDTEGLLDDIESSKRFSKNIIKNNVYKNLIQNKALTLTNDNNENHDNKASPIRKTRSQLNLNEMPNNGSLSSNLIFVVDNNNINNITRKENISKSNNNLVHPRMKKIGRRSVKFKKNSVKENLPINLFNMNDRIGRNNAKKNSLIKSINFKYMVDLSSIKRNNAKNNNSKKRMKFCEYISYFFSCGKFHQKISCYDEFRTRIISEENLILNYLNVCKLLRATKSLIKDREDDKMNNSNVNNNANQK